MININILRQFLNQSYYTQGTIVIKSRSASYDKGHVSDGTSLSETVKQKKVLVPITPREMNDLGFGQFSSAENFWLYTLSALNFQNGTSLQKGDLVEYKNKDFQILSQIDFETHGSYGHLLSSYLGEVLND
jgi:hypothetical protein